MRCLMLLVLASAAQYAQTLPPIHRPRPLPPEIVQPAPAVPKYKPLPLKPYGGTQEYLADPKTFYRFLNDGKAKTPVVPKQPCAIPLLNVLGPSKEIDKDMIHPVPPTPNLPMKEVPLPAPPCDDVKK
jgi:hypothetical protein